MGAVQAPLSSESCRIHSAIGGRGGEGFDGLPSLGASSSAGMGYRGLPAQT